MKATVNKLEKEAESKITNEHGVSKVRIIYLVNNTSLISKQISSNNFNGFARDVMRKLFTAEELANGYLEPKKRKSQHFYKTEFDPVRVNILKGNFFKLININYSTSFLKQLAYSCLVQLSNFRGVGTTLRTQLIK